MGQQRGVEPVEGLLLCVPIRLAAGDDVGRPADSERVGVRRVCGANAGFAGLVLVSISINLDRIVKQSSLIGRSAEPLIVLMHGMDEGPARMQGQVAGMQAASTKQPIYRVVRAASILK